MISPTTAANSSAVMSQGRSLRSFEGDPLLAVMRLFLIKKEGLMGRESLRAKKKE
jgi:hypothetical protein